MKKFSEYVEENTLAEKDLGGGRFEIDESDNTVSFKYFKGGEMNVFKMDVSGDENVSVTLRVNNKEVIMNDITKSKFIMKMREFLQKIK
jgi:hypothetical protein